jgi:hypothetical protein
LVLRLGAVSGESAGGVPTPRIALPEHGARLTVNLSNRYN